MYRKKAHVHFVGIGGIGMSGIAMILQRQGYTISGCDSDMHQKSIKDLQAIGCKIYEGNNTKYCQNSNIDILVYSSAIQHNNPEILSAQARGIPTIPRALMLAELMRTKYSVAIAGSHGKTTTTSLISHILIESGIDPTVIIGGHLKNISTNARLGYGDFLVAEADESDKSLVHLQATLAVLTNIDLEHLETYKNIEDVKNTFNIFLHNLPFYGKAFLCIDDEHIKSLLPMPHLKIIKYGFDSALADIYAQNIQLNPDHSLFTIYKKECTKPLGQITLKMPGRHNIQNCIAAIAVSLDVGVPFAKIANAIETFKGIERRFCYRGAFRGAEIFDDYGHHPKEIEYTLEIAKNRAKKRLIVAFQPHRYTRTHKLWNNFVDAFLQSDVDKLIITDIYPASEPPIANITSKNLVQAILAKNPNFPVVYAPYDNSLSHITEYITKNSQEEDLILSLGAGKITNLAKNLDAIK